MNASALNRYPTALPFFRFLIFLSLIAGIFLAEAYAQQVATTFKNRTSSTVELFWMGADGVGKSYGEIAPGDQKRQAMNAGNLWQVRQGTKVLKEYKATTAKEQTVEVKAGFLERVIGIAKGANQPQTTNQAKSGNNPGTPAMPPAPAAPVNPPAPVTTGSVTVTVVNSSVAPLNLYEDAPDSPEPVHLGNIPAKSQYAVKCDPGTEWILAYEGTALASYTASRKTAQTFALPEEVVTIIAEAASGTDPAAVVVTFTNPHAQTVDVYLVVNPDPNVAPTLFATIGANDSLELEMSPETQWVFGIGGNQVGEYAATGAKSQAYTIANASMSQDVPVVDLTLNNKTGQEVGLYFVTEELDADGKKKLQPVGSIAAGDSVVQPSYIGSTWVFAVGDSPIGDYTATNEAKQAKDIEIASVGDAGGAGGTKMVRGPNGQPIEVPSGGQIAADLSPDEIRKVPSNDPDWDRWVQDRQMDFPLPNPKVSPIGTTFKGESMAADRYSSSGYDVLFMDPRDLGTKPGIVDRNNPIFEPTNFEDTPVYRGFGNYQVPAFYAMKVYDQTEGKSTSMLNFNESQSMSAWRVSAEVGYQGMVGGASASAAYSAAKNQSTASQTMTLKDYKYFSKYWLTLYKQKARLSEEFKQAAIRLPGKDQAAFDRFFHVYGTHYPLSTLYGGMGSRTKTFTRQESGSGSSETFDVSVSGNVAGFSAKAGYGQDKSTSQKMGFESNEEAFISRPAGSFENFGSSPANDFIPIKVVLEEIYELIRPQLFDETDPAQIQKINALREDMKVKLAGYLGSSEGDPKDMGPRKLHAVVTIRSPQVTTFSDNFRNATGGEFDIAAVQQWLDDRPALKDVDGLMQSWYKLKAQSGASVDQDSLNADSVYLSYQALFNALPESAEWRAKKLLVENYLTNRNLPKSDISGTEYNLPIFTAVGVPVWMRDEKTRTFKKLWVDAKTGEPISNDGMLYGAIQIGGQTIGHREPNTESYGSLHKTPKFKWQEAFNQIGRKPKQWDGPFNLAPSKPRESTGDGPVQLFSTTYVAPISVGGSGGVAIPGDDQILVHRYYDTWPTNPPTEVIVSFYEGTVFNVEPTKPLQLPEPPEWVQKR